MAMKKAEMEAESLQYVQWMSLAREAERNGMYRAAVQAAISAWPYVDGMILHERKYGDGEVSRIEAIDIVLRYAPLLLDARPLNDLEALLTTYKRVLKEAYSAMLSKLERAHEQIRDNHRLWSYLEKNPGIRQDGLRQALGGEQERWRSVAESWEKMGLVSRAPECGSYRLALATRMGEVISGKCPTCGRVVQAPKAMFLEAMSCPKCRQHVSFVLLESHRSNA